MKPKTPSEKQIALFQQADRLHQGGQLASALPIYRKLLQIFPKDPELLERVAAIMLQQGNFEQTALLLERSLRIAPNKPIANCNFGIALQNLQRTEEALVAYGRAIRLKPDYADAYINRGTALQRLEHHTEALADFESAIRLMPDYALAYNYRGVAFLELHQPEIALENHDRAIALNPNYAEAYFNRGVALAALDRGEEAVKSYEKAIALQPEYPAAYFNRGNLLHELNKFPEALASYESALALNPDAADVYVNRGILLRDMKRINAALDSFDLAAALDTERADIYINKAILLRECARHVEALENFDMAVAIDPDYDFLYGHRLFTKVKICDWRRLEEERAQITAKILTGGKASPPFTMLAISGDPAVQRTAAAIFAAHAGLPAVRWPETVRYPEHDRIRIGYFSADFRDHPVAYLLAELFEKHDKTRFETIAFSAGRQRDRMTDRLQAAFDRFVDISESSDRQAAALARALEIDIAVDLGGHTQHARTGIFALRAAPVQVGYLGYAGTLGADYLDYLLADRVVVPENSQRHYAERIAYLPHCFMVSDTTRPIAEQAASRETEGLPADAFVFCCFNNAYKFTPEMFACWMRLLVRVDGSVLWLPENDPAACENLRRAAQAAGVTPERLVFARRLPQNADHLARLRLADLFLDTLPYNAHTTASDALWAGLPVLTCPGETFAGRVAASLLTAVGLPELIAADPDRYEALAVELAKNPDKLAALKSKLAANRLATPLFDTPTFARNLEAAYLLMHRRHRAGLPPEVIGVEA